MAYFGRNQAIENLMQGESHSAMSIIQPVKNQEAQAGSNPIQPQNGSASLTIGKGQPIPERKCIDNLSKM